MKFVSNVFCLLSFPSRHEVEVNIYLAMQVLFTLSKLPPVVTEERIINEYSMLYKLLAVWHVISVKHFQLLRKFSQVNSSKEKSNE